MAHRAILLALLGSLCGSPLFAGDWYVDASTGSDGNGGQSAGDAWRTLTHAVASIPTVPAVEHTLHVAPGTYDTAHGEVYPLVPPPLLWIRGTGGSAVTFLADATGQNAGLLAYWGSLGHDERSGAEGLTLRDAARGVTVGMASGGNTASFADLVVHGMSGAGIFVGGGAPAFSWVNAHPRFERVEVFDCNVGLTIRAQAGELEGALSRMTLVEGTIRDCSADGIQILAQGNATARLELERGRVLRNGGHGVFSEAYPEITTARLVARASVFAQNQQDGLFGEAWGGYGEFALTDCTVAHNLQTGVRGVASFEANFKNSIVAGHAVDVAFTSGFQASSSNSPSGAFSGYPGCLAADPLFVDPASGDFRLAWGSPSIDVGDPASAGFVDLLGGTRPFDGDLDTLAAPDMGAFEFRPLHITGTPQPGAVLSCESWGDPGANVRLLVTRGPLVGPSATPFGELWLERPLIQLRPVAAIPAVGPRYWSLTIPPGSQWIGTLHSLQTLTSSAAAPHGAALSNPIEILVVP